MSGEIAGLQLVEVAGRGGMGVVYKAYDPSLDRYIAIKLLRKNHSSDRRLIEQLETEATITASINNPNVVRVYATGFDRGRFYLAMELVDKGSLDDLIHLQGRVAEAQALEVGVQIARGLRAAHQHGLLHRDVKPGNILFADSRTAKIVDFGLALFTHQVEESTGEIWGTPYYIPPEKLDRGNEDFRSDIYSLGAALFHALAGRPPFEAETATLVALKHVKSQAVSLQAFAPWVSNPTAHIINRTLAKNPADRFQSYDDLIHNLEYALEHLQTGGGGAKARARVVLETEDDQKTWTWIVLGMVAIIVVLLGVFVFARPKDHTVAANPSPKAAPAGTAVPAAKFSLLLEVKALASRDAKAPAMFEAVAARDSATPGDRAWAQLLAGAAQLSLGHDAEARAAFEKVGPLVRNVKDEGLGRFLGDLSTRLKKTEPISTGDAQAFHKDTYEAAGLLLAGLNNWQAGALEDGAALLRQFRSTTPAGNAAWLAELKPLATEVVEQFVNFQMVAEQFKSAGNAADRTTASAALRKLGPAFASRSEAIIAPFAAEIANYEKSLTAIPGAGLYRIFNKHSNLVLDVEAHRRDAGGKVHQWSPTGGVNQIWELIPVAGDTFKLRAAHSGMVLNVKDSSQTPGSTIWQWRDDGTSAGLWRIEPKGDGWFFIRAVCSNQVLAVDHMRTDNGGDVTQWDQPGTEDHFWRFEPVGTAAGDWCASDIGEFNTAGETKVEGGAITITVNNGDIWNDKDSCRFVYREIIGDFDFVAHFAAMNDAADWAKTGIMVRSSLYPNARNLLFGYAGKHGVTLQRRNEDNSNTTQENPHEDLKGPGWIKLTRRGSKFTTFHSSNGKDWTQIASEEMGIIREASVGLAASGWRSGKAFTATFDQVSCTQP